MAHIALSVFVLVASFLRTSAYRARVENSSYEDQEWKIVIFWARHGLSCANALDNTGFVGKVGKTLLMDPTLTDCGIRRAIYAGEEFAAWEERNNHIFGGMPGHLDQVFSSNLLRAIETALFEFSRMNLQVTIWPLPYIDENGITIDNAASSQQNQKVFLTNFSGVPEGRPANVGLVGRHGMHWEMFDVNYSFAADTPATPAGKRGMFGKFYDYAATVATGKGDKRTKIQKFYDYFSTNVLPGLIEEKKKQLASNTEGTPNLLKIGIASHSKYMLESFGKLCATKNKPANNEIWAITYSYNAAREARLQEIDCLPLAEAAERMGNATSFTLPAVPKALCEGEAGRCKWQFKQGTLSYKLKLRTVGVCQCTADYPVE